MLVRAQNFLRLSLLLASSCLLDTRPKSHDVCSDDNVYEVTFTEKSGTCGMIESELGQLANNTSRDCTQVATFDTNCGVTLLHECPNFEINYVLDRANGNPDIYVGLAELTRVDCKSLYNVLLTKVNQ